MIVTDITVRAMNQRVCLERDVVPGFEARGLLEDAIGEFGNPSFHMTGWMLCKSNDKISTKMALIPA